ncbi:putative snf2 family helicase snf2 family helicase atpase [Golovinomyces cichoracearum]|uniref:Putative snf2 family helicase snf2 family helicase atpase n=1 Tax=Golovinomyces cichoracearum TaxID=62708 RepID=A0A420IBV2_9PEZI|nr:putative snf2 family helicase snf2 family helicase atpase [Golovinomyces cichoracearum]
MEPELLDMGDPWNWDVDRVVEELCTTNRSWQPQSPAMLTISDPKYLENILREQEVNGSVLLGEINMSILKDDFGIKALGRRSFIMSAIDQFRARSFKYSSFISGRSTNLTSMDLGRSLREVLGQYQQKDHINTSVVPKSPQSILKSGQFCKLSPTQNGHFPPLMNLSNPTERDQVETRVIVDLSDDEIERKRRKTSLGLPVPVQKQCSQKEEVSRHNTPVVDNTKTAPLSSGSQTLDTEKEIEAGGVKRKRITPICLSTTISPSTASKEISTLTSHSSVKPKIINHVTFDPEPSISELVSKPGVVYQDSNGRKRIIPITQSGYNLDKAEPDEIASINVDPGVTNDTSIDLNLSPSKNSTAKILVPNLFLGKKKMNVDTIFYDGVSVGSEMPEIGDQTEFYSGSKITTKGRRLYVHKRLRFFLRSRRQEIISEGKKCSIVVPYPKSLVPKFKDQSFTLYTNAIDGKIVARREVNIEVSNDNIKSIGYEHLAIFNPLNRNLLEQVGTGGEWDFSALEKYKFLEGGDAVLPPYGESDEDNEFDEATWKEIEAEYGERRRPKQKLRKPPISKDEVMEAIHAGIIDIVNSWSNKEFSKRERKAWRLWRQSRRLKNKRAQIIAANIDLNHIQEYLAKIQERILTEVWTSKLQVRRQVGSMEASIIKREQLKWKISVLKQKKQPKRPSVEISTVTIKKSTTKTKNNDDADGEDLSDSDKENSIDDDSETDDFIDYDDDEINTTEEQLHELNFADSENEDTLASDSSNSSELLPSSGMRDYTETERSKLHQESLKSGSFGSKKYHRSSENFEERNHLDNGLSNLSSSSSRETKLKFNGHDSSIPPDSLKRQVVDLTLSVSDESDSEPVCDSPINPGSPKISFIDITLSSEDENAPKYETPPVISSDPLEKNEVMSSDPLKKNEGISSDLLEKNEVIQNYPKVISSTTQPGVSSSTVEARFSDHGINVSPKSDIIPPLKDREAIASYSYEIWQNLGDRRRLLTKYFFQLNSALCLEIMQILTNSSAEKIWCRTKNFYNVYCSKKNKKNQHKDTRTNIFIRIIGIFEMFIDCRYYPFKVKIYEKILQKFTRTKFYEFSRFHKACVVIAQLMGLNSQSSHESNLKGVNSNTSVGENSDKDGDTQSPDERSCSKTTSLSDEESPVKVKRISKRKKIIPENKEARYMREQDLRRLAQQNERRKKLHSTLVKANDDQAIVRSQLIINDAAAEDQKFVYVNDHIAKRIKKHQVEGVRFLWNQIVTIADEQSMQGCLLAHTMGLGKTMQTITLLVAIAEASLSKDPSVSSQIPKSLRISQTLILCPPSLVNNWMDELLVWVPDNMLGELRKVDSSIKSLPQRLQTITDWYREGGVLVIGYEMFRDFINSKSKNISDDEHELVSKSLLEGPNIIIADEAHKMKNRKAAITIAASKFRSKSRIALTGSPLANNVEEYHTMIEWVAPNYLGPIVEFRAKYVEPIQAGNYQNSTAYERRKSLKMLGVLSADLAPKVHRADMSVMKNELPSKKEFVITVPLTDVQREAYSIFVKSMMAGNNFTTTKLGDVTPTTVWHWLAVLSLLCNHPECFRRKLLKRKEEVRNDASIPIDLDGTDNEESVVDLNTPLWKVGISQELCDAEGKLFEAKKSLDSIQMSNKVLLLCQILDACKTIGDKALVFSQSIPTLDFLEDVFKRKNRNYARLDGSTTMSKRQGLTKDFNNGDTDIYLISTTAGGLGLNLQGANRVIIFDFKFNPIMEEQAIGRAYRIGQTKPTFIYRFIAGGTFEDSVHNKTVFKTQLASRVVDKKNPIAWANKKASEFLFEPKTVPQKDLSEFEGMDPCVLDRLLQSQKRRDQRRIARTICSIVQTDTFAVDDDDKLTPDEEKEVQSELEKTRLFRANPQAFHLQQIAEQQLKYQQQLHQTLASSQEINNFNNTNIDQTSMIRANSYSNAPIFLEPTIEILESNSRNSPVIQSLSSSNTGSFSINLKNNASNKSIFSKPHSPVAGANTKVATSSLDTFNPTLVSEPQAEESTYASITERITKNNSSGAEIATAELQNSIEITPIVIDEPEVSQNIDPKVRSIYNLHL